MAGLWDDATEPYTGQPQMADDGSLLSHLYRSFGSPSMFSAPDPSQGQSMFSADPQSITQSIDPSIQPTLALRDPERQRQAMDIALSFGPGAIRAFHGSPHDFPTFDTSKIGTGEGAQAYGHGLYFAEHEPVAQGYRENLAGGPRYSLVGPNGEAIAASTYSPAAFAAPMGERLRDVMHPDYQYLGNSIGRLWAEGKPLDVNSVMDEAFGGLLQNPLTLARLESANPNFRASIQDSIDRAKPVLEQHRIETTQPGRTYEVNLGAEPEHMLDWDKPLSEQPQKIKDILKQKVESMSQMPSAEGRPSSDWIKQYQAGTLPGRMVYRALGGGSDEAATKAWREAGIPGIRYLDRGSRRAGRGTSNYVMFDDKSIDILRKYAVPGLITGGAVGAAANAETDVRNP